MSGETEGNSLNLDLDVKKVGRTLTLGELVQARPEEEVLGCLVRSLPPSLQSPGCGPVPSPGAHANF